MFRERMKVFQTDPLLVRARLLLSILLGALLGLIIAALSPGGFLRGWLAAGLLSSAAVFVLLWAWQRAGGGRRLAWLVALAFVLRLGLGVAFSLALPVWGYDTDCQQAGYLFKDACERDREAFSVAQQGNGIFWFSGIELDSDQYGGLAFLSAWVYRYLSPDAHRPFLILIVCAFFAALGVPYLVRAIRLRWTEPIALAAAWIYTLYPDGLFFGSSQMREPILVGLGALAFWAMLLWKQNWRKSLLAGGLVLAAMVLISTRVTVLVAAFLIVWWWLEFTSQRQERRLQALGWVGLLFALLLSAAVVANWFVTSAAYDIHLTITNSGWIKKIVQEAGEQYAVPIIVIYGLAQPVLPAAIAEDAIALWKGIGIFRAAVWYVIAPFLLYGLLAALRERDPRQKRVMLWLVIAVLGWSIIATIRGGGDQTDNPRYRSLFLPWIALLAAWVIDWVRVHREHWLWRLLAVEGIFLAFFTNWYVSRYWRIVERLPFWHMVAWIVGLSVLVLAGGWIWDRLRARKIRV